MAEMPGMEKQVEQESSGGATELVANIQSQLMQLMEMMGQTPSVPPEDKAQLQKVLQGFEQLVQGLNQPAGPQPQEQPPQGPMPMNQGNKPVSPV